MQWLWNLFGLVVVVAGAGFAAMKYRRFSMARTVLVVAALLLGAWVYLLGVSTEMLAWSPYMSGALALAFSGSALGMGLSVVRGEERKWLWRRQQPHRIGEQVDPDLEPPTDWEPPK